MRPLASWIKIVFWLLALSVLSVAGGYVLARAPLVTVKAVSPGDMVQTVVATGRVQNPHRVDIGAQIVGVVRAVPVKEGQSVRAGQVLIELDDAELRANRMQTEMSVTQAQSQLRRLQEVQAPLAEQSVRQAIINLEQAQRNLARHEELYDRDFIGRATLDESWRQASLSQSQLVSTMHQWVSTHEGGSELAMAQSTLRQAQASHAAAQVRWTYAAIKAPMSGVLIARNVEVGDVVQPGKSLMTLSPSGETQIVVQIDEKHLGLLRLGQHALASADAFPGQRFEAEVIYVNPGIDPQRGSVEVKLRVAAPPAYLRQDMTVSVDIEVTRRSQVLRIPMDAIHDETSAEPWVFTVQEGRVVKTPIRTGLKAAGQVEVLQGLKPGDAVVTQSAKTLSSGQRIRTSRT